MTDPSETVAAPPQPDTGLIDGHGGDHAVAVAAAHGVDTLFTLSGAHVFPMYDGAVNATSPMRLLDVRHEQTAVFAAEAIGKLTRVPGLAVLTAGPGVTNGVSAIAQAQFSGSPLVVVGGRAPESRWGTGSLQEFDHPPLLRPITKLARTVHDVADIASSVDEAFALSGSSHRGPTFLDVPIDQFFAQASIERPSPPQRTRTEPDTDSLAEVGALLAEAQRPILIIGTDVWADGAEVAALRFVEAVGVEPRPAGHRPPRASRYRAPCVSAAEARAFRWMPERRTGLSARRGTWDRGARNRRAQTPRRPTRRCRRRRAPCAPAS